MDTNQPNDLAAMAADLPTSLPTAAPAATVTAMPGDPIVLAAVLGALTPKQTQQIDAAPVGVMAAIVATGAVAGQEGAEGIVVDGPAAANDEADSIGHAALSITAVDQGTLVATAPGTAPDPAVVAATETKVYTDGTSATGIAPMPDQSPAQQDQAAVDALHAKATEAMNAQASFEAAKPALDAITELTFPLAAPPTEGQAALAAATFTKVEAPVPAVLVDQSAPVVLIGSDRQPPTFQFENADWKVTYSLGEVVAKACAQNGMTALQWNSVDQEVRESLIAGQVADLKAIVENTARPRVDGLHSTVRELEVAKALPLAEVGEAVTDPVTHEGCIANFMDEVINDAGSIERRLAKIVVNFEGKLRKVHIPFVEEV